MLVPITRTKFEQLVPLLATGAQYIYFWGKAPDFLKRLLISVVGVFSLLILRLWVGDDYELLFLIPGIVVGLYWLWAPVWMASLRNAACRKHPYSGFWRGQVLDLYITEELIGEEQTVNKKGQLVIVENRERRLNVEVGDETGFSAQLQVPLRRIYKGIRPGQTAEMLVMSYRPDLSSIVKTSDIFIPDRNLWVSDYPYARRDIFAEVSRQLYREEMEAGDRDYPPESDYGDNPPSDRPVRTKRRKRR